MVLPTASKRSTLLPGLRGARLRGGGSGSRRKRRLGGDPSRVRPVDDRAGFRFGGRLRRRLGGLREGAPRKEDGRKAERKGSIHSLSGEAVTD